MPRIKLKQVDGIRRTTASYALDAFLRHCQLKNLSPYSLRYYDKAQGEERNQATEKRRQADKPARRKDKKYEHEDENGKRGKTSGNENQIGFSGNLWLD